MSGRLAVVHQRRLREIRALQCTTDPVFPLGAFEKLVREIGAKYKPNLCYTAEAMACMHACAEHYMVDLCADASGAAAQLDKRAYLQAKDIQVVRSIRSEQCE